MGALGAIGALGLSAVVSAVAMCEGREAVRTVASDCAVSEWMSVEEAPSAALQGVRVPAVSTSRSAQ